VAGRLILTVLDIKGKKRNNKMFIKSWVLCTSAIITLVRLRQEDGKF
jgi:hypothetical protein